MAGTAESQDPEAGPEPHSVPRLRPAEIRSAEPGDLPAIQRIYAHYVIHDVSSFEDEAPDLAEMTARYEAARGRGDPYLVALLAGEVAGYAYASPYHPRPAYRYTREGSLYIAPDRRRHGLGRALLGGLIEACEALGHRRLVALISDWDNQASIGLHRALGFRSVGLLPSVGFKLGRWRDVAILERPLGEGDSTPPAGIAP